MPAETEDTKRIKLVHNEQTKIRAAFYNTIGAGFIVAGVITPISGFARGDGGLSDQAIGIMLLCFAVASVLHYGALRVLETLR